MTTDRNLIEDHQMWQRLAKERVFSMIEAVHKHNEKILPPEIERDIRDALKNLRQEQHVRRKKHRDMQEPSSGSSGLEYEFLVIQ